MHKTLAPRDFVRRQAILRRVALDGLDGLDEVGEVFGEGGEGGFEVGAGRDQLRRVGGRGGGRGEEGADA